MPRSTWIFDRRRGIAPVPLRIDSVYNFSGVRRSSDVVDSDNPLVAEKKKVSVSISDTIQLRRSDGVVIPPSSSSSIVVSPRTVTLNLASASSSNQVLGSRLSQEQCGTTCLWNLAPPTWKRSRDESRASYTKVSPRQSS